MVKNDQKPPAKMPMESKDMPKMMSQDVKGQCKAGMANKGK